MGLLCDEKHDETSLFTMTFAKASIQYIHWAAKDITKNVCMKMICPCYDELPAAI